MEQYKEKYTDELNKGFERWDNKPLSKDELIASKRLETKYMLRQAKIMNELPTIPRHTQDNYTTTKIVDKVLKKATPSTITEVVEGVIEEPTSTRTKGSKAYNEFLSWDRHEIQADRGPTTKYFLKLPRDVITNPFYIKLFNTRGYHSIYNFLYSHIVRLTMNNDRYKIAEKYHSNNKLSCVYTISVMSEYTDLSKSYINEIIDVFEYLDIIKIDKVHFIKRDGTVSDKKMQNIYTLGTWKMKYEKKEMWLNEEDMKKYEETLFIHDVFLTPKI